MKNVLVAYAKFIKDKLVDEGCEFIMQKADIISESIILQFHHNNVSETIIHKILEKQRCSYRIEYGIDVATILLFKE